MSEDCYVFCKEDFCVPVTKMEETDSIQFIIDDFIQKKITFCIYEEGEKCEIWRLVEPTDCSKIKKDNEYAKPHKLYINGEFTENFTLRP